MSTPVASKTRKPSSPSMATRAKSHGFDDSLAPSRYGLTSRRRRRPGADEAALRAMPDVDGIEVRGDTVLIHSGDTNAVARRLLNQTLARDLEITSRGLEEAFIALTGDGAAGPSGGSQAAT